MAVLNFFVKFFGLLFYEMFECFIKLFIPKKPKRVNGRLALITGKNKFEENIFNLFVGRF